MDPISGLLLMAAQLGVKRALGAIMGDDIGGLAAAFLGLVVEAERTQDRLISIETKLDALRDQSFETELRDATRLVERALSRRDSPERVSELAQGQRLLERAVASTKNPMARALAERMAIVVQLLRGDTVAVQQSCRLLDAAAGDAVDDAFARWMAPADEMARRIESGEYGKATWVEQWRLSAGTPDHRYDKARTDVRGEVEEALAALAGLLNFGVRVSALVGSPTGFPAAQVQNGAVAWVDAGSHRVYADVPSGSPVRLGGVTATLSEVQQPLPSRQSTRIVAHPLTGSVWVDPNRQLAAQCMLLGGYADEHITNPGTVIVLPGESATVTGVAYAREDLGVERFGLSAGGLVMAAQVVPARERTVRRASYPGPP